jgi:glyoxylase-like metal-dependent hydrolase (beta-lactamase superfamily II)
VKFISGAADCEKNADEPIQVVKFNENTWVLRQNKCINYEAPFMFLFFGSNKALLMDTGATQEEDKFPLYETVKKLMVEWEKTNHHKVELVVAHTHSHGDHVAADNQFKNKPNTNVVGLGVNDIKTYFNLENWPLLSSKVDLGNRIVEIIPIPGHHQTSVALYDYSSKLLLTGDSFYPGRLYIKDWDAFRLSNQRLIDFTSKHKISYILGNHIEMTNKSGIDYDTGTIYQPNEAPLPLKVKDLKLLNDALIRLGKNPKYEIHDKFVIAPVGLSK